MAISSKGYIWRVGSCGSAEEEEKEGDLVICVVGIGTEGKGKDCGNMSLIRSGDEGSVNGMISIWVIDNVRMWEGRERKKRKEGRREEEYEY